MSTINSGVSESTPLHGTVAKVGNSFGKALVLVVSVKVAELVVEQAARGVKALWVWFAGNGKPDTKGKPQKKAKHEPQEQAA